jgi:hypothetical protein
MLDAGLPDLTRDALDQHVQPGVADVTTAVAQAAR